MGGRGPHVLLVVGMATRPAFRSCALAVASPAAAGHLSLLLTMGGQGAPRLAGGGDEGLVRSQHRTHPARSTHSGTSFLPRESFILVIPPADNEAGECRGHSEGGQAVAGL